MLFSTGTSYPEKNVTNANFIPQTYWIRNSGQRPRKPEELDACQWGSHLPNIWADRHYLKTTSCYLCTGVWGWCSCGCTCICIYVEARIQTQFCFLRSCLPCVLRQFLIDLGSSIRLLVDEQAPGIFLSMSLGVQTRVLLWLTWWGVVRGTKFTFSCLLRKYFMMSISPVLYHYFLNKQFILAP